MSHTPPPPPEDPSEPSRGGADPSTPTPLSAEATVPVAATGEPAPPRGSDGPAPPDGEPPVWHHRWFQALLAALVIFVVLSFVLPGVFGLLYAVRSVLVPLLIGLALAYICNPLLRFAERRLKIGRLAGTMSLMLLALVLAATILVYAVPVLFTQGSQLINAVQKAYPSYVDQLMRQIEAETGDTPAGRAEVEEDDGDDDDDAALVDASQTLQPFVAVAEEVVKDTINGSGDGPAATDPAGGQPGTRAGPGSPPGDAPDAAADDDPNPSPPTDRPASAGAPASADEAGPGPIDEAEGLGDVDVPNTFFTRLLEQERNRRIMEASVNRMRELDWSVIAAWLMQSLDVGVGLVGTAIGLTSYFMLAGVVIAFCFFFFSWKLDAMIAWFQPYIPEHSREKTLHVFGKMDEAVSSFVRGRVIQSLIMMVVLIAGWWIAGVPYWFLLGVVTGVLNLVPFLPAVGWLVALLLTVLSALSVGEGFTLGLVLWPTVVYAIAQGLDGWLVEPWVQGKATNLDPLTVLLAVLIGGSLLGLVGMLLAIPLTACIKILMREVALPRLKRMANPPPDPEPQ
jgi:predicted PurR-regulated permease PerM